MTMFSHPSVIINLVVGALMIIGITWAYAPAVRRWYLLTCKHICPDCGFDMYSYLPKGNPYSEPWWYCPRQWRDTLSKKQYNPCGGENDQ
jgi:hypothetical protein